MLLLPELTGTFNVFFALAFFALAFFALAFFAAFTPLTTLLTAANPGEKAVLTTFFTAFLQLFLQS